MKANHYLLTAYPACSAFAFSRHKMLSRTPINDTNNRDVYKRTYGLSPVQCDSTGIQEKDDKYGLGLRSPWLWIKNMNGCKELIPLLSSGENAFPGFYITGSEKATVYANN